MLLYFDERLRLVTTVVAPREARKASNEVKSAAHTTIRSTTVDTHQAGHCWWIFPQKYFVKVTVALVYLCVEVQGLDQLEDAEDWRLQNACEVMKVVCIPSPWSQQADSWQSQGVDWLSTCRSDQPAEHVHCLRSRETDVCDQCCESQRVFWVECKDSISEVDLDHNRSERTSHWFARAGMEDVVYATLMP